MAIKKNKTDYHNSPAAWFCQLEIARNKEDFERAALAVRELKRLGVTVKFQGRTGKKLAEAQQVVSKQRPTVPGAETSR